MEHADYATIIEDQGYDIVYNPPGDGNCQFEALANRLSALGIFRVARNTAKGNSWIPGRKPTGQ